MPARRQLTVTKTQKLAVRAYIDIPGAPLPRGVHIRRSYSPFSRRYRSWACQLRSICGALIALKKPHTPRTKTIVERITMQPLRVTTGPLTGVQENGTLARLRIRRWIPCEPGDPFASTGIMPVQKIVQRPQWMSEPSRHGPLSEHWNI